MTIKINDNYFEGQHKTARKVLDVTVTLAGEPLEITAATLGLSELKEVTPFVQNASDILNVGIVSNEVVLLEIDAGVFVVDGGNVTGTISFTVKGV